MKLNMVFKDYLDFLRGYSNSPLTLNRLTLPFGIISNSVPSSTLLVGHVLEDLCERINLDQAVDCVDVVASAYDLGHEPAGDFLDEIPQLINKMAADLGVPNFH